MRDNVEGMTAGGNMLLSLTASYKKFSSAKFYTIALVGHHATQLHNQNLLAKLFFMRRLYKRTYYMSRFQQVQERLAHHAKRQRFVFLKSRYAVLRAVNESIIAKAESFYEIKRRRAFHAAYRSLKSLSALMNSQNQFLERFRVRIYLNPSAVRALHLIRNAVVVKFFLALQEHLEYSEITSDEIEKAEKHKVEFVSRLSLHKWLRWKREMSHQRVNAKNYPFYRYVLLKRLAPNRAEYIKDREHSVHTEKWMKGSVTRALCASFLSYDAFAAPLQLSQSPKHSAESALFVPNLNLSSTRINVADCIDSINRMRLLYGLSRLWEWAACRRVYYSLSDVVYSNCSDEEKRHRMGNERISSHAAIAVRYDNASSIKVRPLHKRSPSATWRQARVNVGWMAPVSFFLNECNVHIDSNPIDLENRDLETPETIVVGAHQRAVMLAELENGRQHAVEIVRGYQASALPRLSSSRFRNLVSFDPNGESFNLILNPVNPELVRMIQQGTSGLIAGLGEAVSQLGGRAGSVDISQSVSEDIQPRRLDNLRRGLVRAKTRQEELHSSNSIVRLFRTLQPPGFIAGGELDMKDCYSEYGESAGVFVSMEASTHAQQKVTKRFNMLATGPTILLYTRRWLVTARISKRLRTLSALLKSKIARKLKHKYWHAIRGEFLSTTWRRRFLGHSHVLALRSRAEVLCTMKSAMKSAIFSRKLVQMRTFLSKTTNQSFDKLMLCRKLVSALRDKVDMAKCKPADVLPKTNREDYFGDSVFDRRSVTSITPILREETQQERYMRCLRQRVLFVFFRACGNRQGSEFSALENVFLGKHDGATGFAARQVTTKTALLVSKALNWHSRIRMLFNRLRALAQRRSQHKRVLVAVLQNEQRNGLRGMRYAVQVRQKFYECRTIFARRSMRKWRISTILVRNKRAIQRACMKFLMERHLYIQKINSFFDPFVANVHKRRKFNAFLKWKYKYQTVVDRYEIVHARVVTSLVQKVFCFSKQWLKARRWAELRTLRLVFLELRKNYDYERKKFLKVRPFSRFRSFLQSRIVRRKSAMQEFIHGKKRRVVFSLRFMCRPPTIRFKHVFLNVAVKLRNHPVCKTFFRPDHVDSLYRHLHQHHRRSDTMLEQLQYDIAHDKLTVRRGELLRCMTIDSLCCDPIFWLARNDYEKSSDLCMNVNHLKERARPKLGGIVTGSGLNFTLNDASNDVSSRFADAPASEHCFGYAPGTELSCVRKEAAILAFQLGRVAKAYINANCMGRSLFTWQMRHQYNADLKYRVTHEYRHVTVQQHALRTLKKHAVTRAIVRSNAHKILYLRTLQKIEELQKRRQDECAMLHLSDRFHDDKRLRCMLMVWQAQATKRSSSKSRRNMSVAFKESRGKTLALWLMRAACARRPNFALPESHVNKIHYVYRAPDEYDFGFNQENRLGKKTKREMRADQRAREGAYRTPDKRRTDVEQTASVVQSNRRLNFLALSIMRSPNLK